jgi:protease I
MPGILEGKRVAIIATDGVEQIELVEVRKALDDAGAETVLVSPKADSIQAFRHHEKADRFPVDMTLADAHPADFSALYLPGGGASADALRTEQKAVQFTREFMAADKPVAAICHGPLLLIEAEAVAGRKLASSPSLKTDIQNAGGEWVDQPVVVDGDLITSRKPEDIPAFSKRILAEFSSQITEREVDRTSEQSFPASDPPPGPAAIGGTGASSSAG